MSFMMQFAISSSFLANISGKVNGYWRQFVYGHVVVVVVIVDVAMTCRQHLRPLEIASRCQMRRQTATTTTTQHSTKKQRHGNAATLSVFLFPFAILACYFFAGYALCTHTHTSTHPHTLTAKKKQQKKQQRQLEKRS